MHKNFAQLSLLIKLFTFQAEHCTIEREGDERLYLSPLTGARTCVNGAEVSTRTQLHHGDRILWGSNHFFRVNCPRPASSNSSSMTGASCGGAVVPPTPTTPFDWRMAQEEVMLGEVANAPMREAIALLEAQYEADKRYALENQRKEFEKQFQHLRSFLSPATTPMAAGPPAVPLAGFGKIQDRGGGLYRAAAVAASPSVQSRLDSWGRQQDETFQQGLAKLRQDLVLVNGLVREANYLAQEIGAEASFGVTLQIPPHKLTPNRTPGAFLSEPAILVRRRRPQQRPQQWPQHQGYQEKALSSAATTQVNSFG
jgi:kinesin family protein 13